MHEELHTLPVVMFVNITETFSVYATCIRNHATCKPEPCVYQAWVRAYLFVSGVQVYVQVRMAFLNVRLVVLHSMVLQFQEWRLYVCHKVRHYITSPHTWNTKAYIGLKRSCNMWLKLPRALRRPRSATPRICMKHSPKLRSLDVFSHGYPTAGCAAHVAYSRKLDWRKKRLDSI